MSKKIIILAVILALGITAWFVFNPFKEPTFITIRDIEIEKMEGNIASIKAIAVFNNPNNLDATLLNTELKVYSNSAYIGNVSQTGLSEIKARSDFDIPLHFQVDLLKLGYSQSLAGLVENALNKEKVLPIKFDGYCRIKTLGAVHKIPVEFEDKLKFE